jgi:hypothetical protein
MDKMACLRDSWDSVSMACQRAADRWGEELEKREVRYHETMEEMGKHVKHCLMEQPTESLSESCVALIESNDLDHVSSETLAVMAGYGESAPRATTFPIVVAAVVGVLLCLTVVACLRNRKNPSRVAVAPEPLEAVALATATEGEEGVVEGVAVDLESTSSDVVV